LRRLKGILKDLLSGQLDEPAQRVHKPHVLVRQRISSSFGEQTSTASACAREIATFRPLRENRKPIERTSSSPLEVAETCRSRRPIAHLLLGPRGRVVPVVAELDLDDTLTLSDEASEVCALVLLALAADQLRLRRIAGRPDKRAPARLPARARSDARTRGSR
jgi:hypothetical protein